VKLSLSLLPHEENNMRRFVVFYTFVLLAVGSVQGQQKNLRC
jgi:hypothetical protein